VALTSSSLNQFVLIDITPLVQEWEEGTEANDGIALALTTGAGNFSFDSKEATDTSHEPELEIVLTGPTGPQGPEPTQNNGRIRRWETIPGIRTTSHITSAMSW
jgi:hypothetical protein